MCVLLLSACGGEVAPMHDAGPARDGSSLVDAYRADTGPVAPSDAVYADCGGRIFDPTTGALDPAEYDRQAHLWDRAAIDCRLGPTFDELRPGAPDDRPTLFEPAADPARVCGGGNAFQRYQFGPTGCDNSCPGGGSIDYLSTAGQVGYEPDGATDTGVDRLTTFGVDAQLVAVAPQFGPPRESSHPDADLLSPMWPARGFASGQPIAMSRNHLSGGYSSHQALVVFQDGFVGGMGTITDGVSGGLAILQVGYDFPDHLVPTSVAISSHNELAFVTLWDTDAHVGRLGVFAMQSNFPLYDLQTWWYVGLPSSGAFTAMKYLGDIELPMATPTSISVATNGIQANGPHATGGRRLGEFGLIHDGACDPSIASQFSVEVADPGQLADIVATRGYAIIASRWEHRVVLVDLEPLLHDLRHDYFEDIAFCTEHVAPAHVWTGDAEGIGNNPGSHQFDGEDRWPYPFVRTTTTGPTLAPPVVAAMFDVEAPIDVEAGFQRGGGGPPRAFVLGGDGTLHTILVERLFSTSPRTAAPTADPHFGPSVDVCDHPTSMTLHNANDSVWLACRGDRTVQGVSFGETSGSVTGEIRDALLDDPVAVDTNDRGPILTVADFGGRAVVNYQLGEVSFSCADVPLSSPPMVQRGGALAIAGTPWLLSGANVN
jgi:hypothetical protein